ncbi:ABC transporter permease, partial [Kitasatospora sp. NPDC057198]|uniref:ABC transporter permease n=1 Tax=Kitasatospora sp. NPDC057198 TaxID=3346046 RepID=UPI00362FD491
MPRRPARTPRPSTPATLRGTAHHLLPLTAAALAVLLSALAVATLCTVSDRAVVDGMRGQLADDPRTAVAVRADYRADGYRSADRAVRAALARTLAGTASRTDTALRAAAPMTTTRPAGAPLPSGTALLPLAVTDTRRYAVLTDGSWPETDAGPDGRTDDGPAGRTNDGPDAAAGTGSGAPAAGSTPAAPVPAVLPQEAVRRLGLRPGDTLLLTTPANRTLVLRVTGSYRPAPGTDAYWRSLGEGGAPVAEQAALLPPAVFVRTPALTERAVAVWTALPEPAALRPAAAAALHGRVAALAGGDPVRSVYRQAAPALAGTTVRTDLPQALADTALPMLAARSSLYVPVTLLTALAALTLLLTTRRLTEHRRGEQGLRLARGAGPWRLLAEVAAEWALVVLPAAVAGLLLARFAARALTGRADLGLLPPAGAFAAVGLVLLVHAVGTLAPAVRLAAAGGRDGVVRRRSPRRAAAQRTGADLALLV